MPLFLPPKLHPPPHRENVQCQNDVADISKWVLLWEIMLQISVITTEKHSQFELIYVVASREDVWWRGGTWLPGRGYLGPRWLQRGLHLPECTTPPGAPASVPRLRRELRWGREREQKAGPTHQKKKSVPGAKSGQRLNNFFLLVNEPDSLSCPVCKHCPTPRTVV